MWPVEQRMCIRNTYAKCHGKNVDGNFVNRYRASAVPCKRACCKRGKNSERQISCCVGGGGGGGRRQRFVVTVEKQDDTGTGVVTKPQQIFAVVARSKFSVIDMVSVSR
jgi:hypothetical protein